MLKLKSLTTRDALRAAANKGCLDAVRFFVEEGVHKDEADENGRTPLILASQNNHSAVVQFLEEYTTDKKKSDMSLKKKTANTRDALRAAANKGCMEAVRFLVEEKVNLSDKDKEGKTPLLLAVESGHLAIARYLVESMQEGMNDADNSWGNTALLSAARNGHLTVIRWLLEQGADKDKANKRGHTALLCAIFMTQTAAAQLLLEQGADVNKTDENGWMPLHHAVGYCPSELVTCLMNWGADLTARIESKYFSYKLPIDMTHNEAIKQLIRDEETRRRDHGYKRAVIPNPTEAERKRARLDRGEDEEETEGQGQPSASAVAGGDDAENDDSGSDIEY